MSDSAAARFVWLSDPHYDAAPVLGHDPSKRLNAAIDVINQHYPDATFCVISGDMVETASDAAYRDLKAHLDRLEIPWWPMTGNHDNRALLRRHLPLPDGCMDGFVQYVLEAGPVRLLCLDSLNDGQAGGVLCPARLDWLERQLHVLGERPTLVMLHHPPMDLGLPMLDAMRLENGADFLETLRRFPSVRQLCFGHIHRPVSGQIGGLAYCGLRSLLYQAPPPVPAWDWSSFAPASEAPQIAVVSCDADQISLQMLDVCSADYGVTRGERA